MVPPHSFIQWMFSSASMGGDHQLHSQTLSYEAGIAVGTERDPLSDIGRLTFLSGRHALHNGLISNVGTYHMRNGGRALHS